MIGKAFTKSMDLLLCDLIYNVRSKSKLEHTSHDVFWPNDMDGIYDLSKTLINFGLHGHLSFLCFHFRTRSKESSFDKREGGCERQGLQSS